jgi:hypothetical protein
MKKILTWYNTLQQLDMIDLSEEESEQDESGGEQDRPDEDAGDAREKGDSEAPKD